MNLNNNIMQMSIVTTIFFSFFTSVFFLLCGNILGKKIMTKIAMISVILLNLCLWLIFVKNIFVKKIFLEKLNWIQINDITINFLFVGDSLSLSMALLVSTITGLIITYSLAYLNEDPCIIRFIAYLFLFLFSMLLMVTAGNYIQFFIGWEYVGIASYLLINYWYTRNEANKGALKAVIYNRIGDVFFLLALAILWLNFRSFDFAIIFTLIPFFVEEYISVFGLNLKYIDILALFLFLAASAKSAQLFFHNWLVDAMEGPTPVSALLHSATMVTAGIYLILRSSRIFMYSNNISILMLVVGALTMIISSLIALFQNDIKRIVAFSTCSQLGLMMLSAGFHCYNATYFHLVTHAFFKSALFLSCGIIIHALKDEQDIRNMGVVAKFMPSVYICTLISSFSLMGFPMLAGFYSKDFLLESVSSSFEKFAFIVFLLGSFAAGLTTLYSFRFLFLIFFNKANNYNKNLLASSVIVHLSYKMTIPFYILSFFAIIIGYFFKELFTISSLSIWGDIFAVPFYTEIYDVETEISSFYKTLPLFMTIIAAILIYLFYKFTRLQYTFILYFYKTYVLLSRKMFFDYLYHYFIVTAILKGGYHLFYKTIDKGFLEYIGPYGIFSLCKFTYKQIRNLHNGYIITYIFLILFYFFNIILVLIFTSNVSVMILFLFEYKDLAKFIRKCWNKIYYIFAVKPAETKVYRRLFKTNDNLDESQPPSIVNSNINVNSTINLTLLGLPLLLRTYLVQPQINPNIQQPLQTLENFLDLSLSDPELEVDLSLSDLELEVPVAGSLPNLEVAPANIQQPLQDITVTHEKEKDIINTPANIVTQVVASLPNLEVAPTNIQQPLQTLENSVDLSFSDLELEAIGVPVAGSLPNLEVAPANIQQPLQDITVTHEKEKDIINTPANIVTQVVASLPNLEVAPTNIQQPLQTLENISDLELEAIAAPVVQNFLQFYNSHEEDLELNTLSIKDIVITYQSVNRHNYDYVKDILFSPVKNNEIHKKLLEFDQIIIRDDSTNKKEILNFINRNIKMSKNIKSLQQTCLHEFTKMAFDYYKDNISATEQISATEESIIRRNHITVEFKNAIGMAFLFKNFYTDIFSLFRKHDIRIKIFDPLAKQLLLSLQDVMPMNGEEFIVNPDSRAKMMSLFFLFTENVKNLFTDILTEKGIEPANVSTNIKTCINNYSRYIHDNSQSDTLTVFSSLHNLASIDFRIFYQDYNVFEPEPKVPTTGFALEVLLALDLREKLSTYYILQTNLRIHVESLSKEMQCKLLEIFEIPSLRIDHKYQTVTTVLMNNVSYELCMLVMFDFTIYKDRSKTFEETLGYKFQKTDINLNPNDITKLDNLIIANGILYSTHESKLKARMTVSTNIEQIANEELNKRLEIYAFSRKTVAELTEIAYGIADTSDLV
jgi:NADH-ubiquinone oxidoreductase chain 5